MLYVMIDILFQNLISPIYYSTTIHYHFLSIVYSMVMYMWNHVVQAERIVKMARSDRIWDLDLACESHSFLSFTGSQDRGIFVALQHLLVPCLLTTLHLWWSQCLLLHHCFHQTVPGESIQECATPSIVELVCDWPVVCLQVSVVQQAGECQQAWLQWGHESSLHSTSVSDDQSLPASLDKVYLSEHYPHCCTNIFCLWFHIKLHEISKNNQILISRITVQHNNWTKVTILISRCAARKYLH